MFKVILTIVISTALLSSLYASTIYVPDDYATIQGAIDASVNGDTVIVRPGMYVENIDFVGKAITVKSDQGAVVTSIDGNQAGSVVTFQSSEDADSVLDGFTLTNGSGHSNGNYNFGGGISCDSSSPTISNNTISGNTANYGGGVSCGYGSPTIANNTFSGNKAISFYGGGIFCYQSSAPIIYNTLTGNTADWGGGISCDKSSATVIGNTLIENAAQYQGGGIYCHESSDFVSNNTIIGNTAIDGGGISCMFNSTTTITGNSIAGNSAASRGGGIHCFSLSSATVTNTIVWDNNAQEGPEISVDNEFYSSTLAISYSDVKGGQASVHVDQGCTLTWGPGMIDADPLFAETANHDFHLTWNSPCRDTGDSSVVTEPLDFENDPRIVGTTVDMGADEFYYHLYHTGDVVPGDSVDLKIIGYPQAPVTFAWGQTIIDPPLSTQHGNLCIWPLVWSGFIGNVQSNGVLSMPVTIPSTWQAGDHAPLQALVGPWGGGWTKLTNLNVVTVE